MPGFFGGGVELLTEEEQESVLKAIEYIGTRDAEYSCHALERTSSTLCLVKRYCEFYGKKCNTWWLSFEGEDFGFTSSYDWLHSEQIKHLRVMLLLNFLEVNS